jgi:hypothetical protein
VSSSIAPRKLRTSTASRGRRRGLTGAIGADGVQVSAIGFYLVRALRAAATARFDLMGWNDAEWQEDERIFAETVLRANKSST